MGERRIMKQLLKCETITALIIAVIISDLVLAPFICDVSHAQLLDLNGPVISHHPRTIGQRDKPLQILAHVGAQTAVKKVVIKITQNNKTVSGVMPVKKNSTEVPVIVTASKDLTIYAGAGTRYSKKGIAQTGETLYVTDVRPNYYRVRTDAGVSGWVESSNTEQVLAGKVYLVAIPATMTAGSSLTYQLFASDSDGHSTSTDAINVTLMTEDEIASIKEGKLPPKEQALAAGVNKSSFNKFFPWVVLLGIGGAAAYFLTQKSKTENDATVDVMVDWN
jgi:hypothetical protein